MSKTDILSFFYANSENLTPFRIVIIMGISLILAAIILLTYRFTCEHDIYSSAFATSNLLMVLLTTVIMLMISTNIVISLGMVGALSIVRFRTAVKDPRDTIYLFWSIVTGLCTGSQNFILSVVSTLIISAVLFIIYLFPKRKTRFTLVVRGNGLELQELEKELDDGNIQIKLQAMNKSDAMGEFIFTLSGKQEYCTNAALKLEKLNGIMQVNLIAPDNN